MRLIAKSRWTQVQMAAESAADKRNGQGVNHWQRRLYLAHRAVHGGYVTDIADVCVWVYVMLFRSRSKRPKNYIAEPRFISRSTYPRAICQRRCRAVIPFNYSSIQYGRLYTCNTVDSGGRSLSAGHDAADRRLISRCIVACERA